MICENILDIINYCFLDHNFLINLGKKGSFARTSFSILEGIIKIIGGGGGER